MQMNLHEGVQLNLENTMTLANEILKVLDKGPFSITVIDALHSEHKPRIEQNRTLTDHFGPHHKKVTAQVRRDKSYAAIGLNTNAETWSITSNNQPLITIRDHVVTIEQIVDDSPVKWILAPQ